MSLLRKLEREKELLEKKIQTGEETNNELHSESSNLRSQLLEKQNDVPLLAQEAEILKEKYKRVQTGNVLGVTYFL